MNKRRAKPLYIIMIAALLAAGFTPPAAAEAAAAYVKEEIIYANLAADGAVNDVYVVNMFDSEQALDIIDYGAYHSVVNLSGSEPLTLTGDTVSLHKPAGKLYYQGDLGAAQLPWLIAVRYYLDGQPIEAAQLGGQSGQLTMQLEIKRNAGVNALYFDNYALQISGTFDGEKCAGITAEDATIAAAGADKSVSFIVLAGEETTLECSATVTDFAFSGWQFAGISLALSIDDVDSGDFMDDIRRLQDGVIELEATIYCEKKRSSCATACSSCMTR
ncbi:MAG: hypothetical protein Q4B96_04055 [Bacillota bacterium]|nr:hypothetical protein [Bacillota bacterium]